MRPSLLRHSKTLPQSYHIGIEITQLSIHRFEQCLPQSYHIGIEISQKCMTLYVSRSLNRTILELKFDPWERIKECPSLPQSYHIGIEIIKKILLRSPQPQPQSYHIGIEMRQVESSLTDQLKPQSYHIKIETDLGVVEMQGFEPLFLYHAEIEWYNPGIESNPRFI
jgi:hypothetical protein